MLLARLEIQEILSAPMRTQARRLPMGRRTSLSTRMALGIPDFRTSSVSTGRQQFWG